MRHTSVEFSLLVHRCILMADSDGFPHQFKSCFIIHSVANCSLMNLQVRRIDFNLAIVFILCDSFVAILFADESLIIYM
jgi:hypothetical protein